MGLLSLLTGGISQKYEAVQGLANELSQADAAYCYGIGFMHLCSYLNEPRDMANSRFNKTAYVEVLVSLHERLRGFDPWFSRNKSQFRMELTRAVVRDFAAQGTFKIAKILGEFNFVQVVPRKLSQGEETRLGYHVMAMLEIGP